LFADAVVVRELVKIYGGEVIGVNGISFTIKDEEIYGLIGPNGSGKTTTLRIISTLIKPSKGEVYVYGIDIIKEPLRARNMISYLPEEAGAYRDLSGYDFMRFMLSLRFSGERLKEAIEEAAEIADLGGSLKRPVRTYSKGMKRILALSTVLASRARLLVLDEPTTGLDVERSMYVRDLIRKYNMEYGATILLSSHNMLEVEYLSTRVGLLHKGKMIAEGTVQELKDRVGARSLEEVYLRIKGGAD